jgi:hypothetical protein
VSSLILPFGDRSSKQVGATLPELSASSGRNVALIKIIADGERDNPFFATDERR